MRCIRICMKPFALLQYEIRNMYLLILSNALKIYLLQGQWIILLRWLTVPNQKATFAQWPESIFSFNTSNCSMIPAKVFSLLVSFNWFFVQKYKNYPCLSNGTVTSIKSTTAENTELPILRFNPLVPAPLRSKLPNLFTGLVSFKFNVKFWRKITVSKISWEHNI